MRTIYPSSCRKQFSTIQGVQGVKCPFHNAITVFFFFKEKLVPKMALGGLYFRQMVQPTRFTISF